MISEGFLNLRALLANQRLHTAAVARNQKDSSDGSSGAMTKE
jgi:hypothetical protein